MKRRTLRQRAERHMASWSIPTCKLAYESEIAFRERLAWLAGYESGRRDAARKRREGTQILESVKDDTPARAVSRYLQLHGNANAQGDQTEHRSSTHEVPCSIFKTPGS